MPDSLDVHKRVRQYRPPAFADFMDEVYRRIPEPERKSLPDETGAYVNAMVQFALTHISEFGEALAEMIAGVYSQSPSGERFILDPVRSDKVVTAALFLDSDGHLVSVRNAKLDRTPETSGELGAMLMTRYQSYEVLTGPLSGERFAHDSRPLPIEPVYRPGVVLGSGAATLYRPVRSPTASRGLRVFLCHASEDKDAVRSLYRQLQQSGFHPWLDQEDLLPGQDWNAEIIKAVRQTDIVLVCLSTRSERRGYVQKEIVRALDVADEQPEGAIFLIPVRLEDCDVPDRLKRWQWVDLFAPNGYSKLEVALKLAEKGRATSGGG